MPHTSLDLPTPADTPPQQSAPHAPLFPLPDAEAQCAELAGQIEPHLTTHTQLVGIHSGGAWLAHRLQALLRLKTPPGLLDISFYRDDFGRRGQHPQVKPSSMPLDVEDRPLILVDDVLYTGRTVRAAINELFDYGRPASIRLAVLADRGERELPIQADFCAWRVTLAPTQELILESGANDGRLHWRCEDHA